METKRSKDGDSLFAWADKKEIKRRGQVIARDEPTTVVDIGKLQHERKRETLVTQLRKSGLLSERE